MTGWPLLYGRQEAADVLHTSPTTIDRLVNEGRLSSVQLFPDEPPQFRPQDLIYFVDTNGDEQAERTATALKEAAEEARVTAAAEAAALQFAELLESLGPDDLVHVVAPVGDEQIKRAAAQAAALQELRELLDGSPELRRLVDEGGPAERTIDDVVDAATQIRMIELWVRTGLFPTLPTWSDDA